MLVLWSGRSTSQTSWTASWQTHAAVPCRAVWPPLTPWKARSTAAQRPAAVQREAGGCSPTCYQRLAGAVNPTSGVSNCLDTAAGAFAKQQDVWVTGR